MRVLKIINTGDDVLVHEICVDGNSQLPEDAKPFSVKHFDASSLHDCKTTDIGLSFSFVVENKSDRVAMFSIVIIYNAFDKVDE